MNMIHAVLNQNKILEHEGVLRTNASPSILVIGTMGNIETAQTRLSVWGKKGTKVHELGREINQKELGEELNRIKIHCM